MVRESGFDRCADGEPNVLHALIIDGNGIVRDPLVTIVSGWGFEAVGAATCAEVWEYVRTGSPDLIVIDPDLNGEDGLRLLGRLLAEYPDKNIAVIVLTNRSERAAVIEAARLGVRHYLLKQDFHLDQFKHRVDLAIRRAGLAPITEDPATDGARDRGAGQPGAAQTPKPTQASSLSQIEPVIRKEKAVEMIRGYGECRALSPTFNYAMKLLNDSRASVESIAAAIKQDQAIAVRVLRAANSAGYHRGHPVHTVEQAAVRIGLTELRQIVMGIAVVEEFGGEELKGFMDVLEFWTHSMAVAVICQMAARETRHLPSETAFLVGLIHDVGQVIMIEQFGPGYADGITAGRRLGQPLHLVEKRLYHIDHAEAAGVILKAWHFPEELYEPVCSHHLSLGNLKHLAPGSVEGVATLIFADRLAVAMLLGSDGGDTLHDIAEMADVIGLNRGSVTRMLQTVPRDVQEFKMALSAASGMACETRTTEKYQGMIDEPLSPVVINPAGTPDPVVIMLGQLASGGAAPNLAVVRYEGPDTVPDLLARIEAAEKEAERPLPLLVSNVTSKPPIEALTEGRVARVVGLPVRCEAVAEVVSVLLSEGAEHAEHEAPSEAA